MPNDAYKRYKELRFKDFRMMAQDPSLSSYEKIGFPDSYRKGREEAIFQDIEGKLSNLVDKNKVVLDIGPGCSDLPLLLIELCRKQRNELILVDSAEMLSQLPDEPFIKKVSAYYPKCEELFKAYSEKVDVILTYSVLQYVFVESNLWDFVDRSLSLLSHGGQMLIGDIPNITKRKRFFTSPSGIQYHKEFTGSEERPEVVFNTLDTEEIDDSVIFAILMRARNAGHNAYVLPQDSSLPMANRREDILINRP